MNSISRCSMLREGVPSTHYLYQDGLSRGYIIASSYLQLPCCKELLSSFFSKLMWEHSWELMDNPSLLFNLRIIGSTPNIGPPCRVQAGFLPQYSQPCPRGVNTVFAAFAASSWAETEDTCRRGPLSSASIGFESAHAEWPLFHLVCSWVVLVRQIFADELFVHFRL